MSRFCVFSIYNVFINDGAIGVSFKNPGSVIFFNVNIGEIQKKTRKC